jgi:hypothetical protein
MSSEQLRVDAQALDWPKAHISTFSAIQCYAQTWSGDNSTSWESLRWNLRTGLTMSLSGLFNVGHDVGGFSGSVPVAELLVRLPRPVRSIRASS